MVNQAYFVWKIEKHERNLTNAIHQHLQQRHIVEICYKTRMQKEEVCFAIIMRPDLFPVHERRLKLLFICLREIKKIRG